MVYKKSVRFTHSFPEGHTLYVHVVFEFAVERFAGFVVMIQINDPYLLRRGSLSNSSYLELRDQQRLPVGVAMAKDHFKTLGTQGKRSFPLG